MTRFERNEFFERLCQLRALYALRGRRDSTSMLSIQEAIQLAVRQLDDASQAGDRVEAPNVRRAR